MATADEIRRAQQDHRRRLVESWSVRPGTRLLEIGCGQGDMTEILAEAVGPTGHITAVDIASRDYGTPLNLGQATDILLNSDLGNRISFRFDFNALDDVVQFPDHTFDGIVMAHSSWYFDSPDQLEQTFRKIRPWSKYLYFAEYDLQISHIEQLPHLLAILIQGQVESFRTTSDANVRTPLEREHLVRILTKSGWRVDTEKTIDSPSLQDADWEIKYCVSAAIPNALSMNLPSKFTAFLDTQITLLQRIAKQNGNRPLSCYSVTAL